MALTVAYRGGTKFHISNGKHQIVTDQPLEEGGTGMGMTPVELFVASLAGCVAYFTVRYCQRHGIPTKGLLLDVEWTTAEQPHRVGSVAIRLHVPMELSETQREKLLKVAHGCTVHQTLVVPPTVEIIVEPPLVASSVTRDAPVSGKEERR
jgi:uncharacterized OsmC-like protein